MNKFYNLIIIISMIFIFSNFQQILGQNETLEILLEDVLERQEKFEEKTIKNEMQSQFTQNELEKLRNEINEKIKNIEESSQLERALTFVGTVIAIIISGYLGFHIHKREFNADLSRKHFEDIKKEILTPLKNFIESSIRYNEPYAPIFYPSLGKISKQRSMDFTQIKWADGQNRSLESRELNISLLQDTISNHYPMIINDMNRVETHALKYNRMRKEISKEIVNFLESHVESKCKIISTSDFHIKFTENSEKFEDYFLLDTFANNLTDCILGRFKEEDFEIREHLSGKAIAISAPESQNIRVLYLKRPDLGKWEPFVKECISKIFKHEEIMSKISEAVKEFGQFQESSDKLSINIDRILNKTILRTRKKLLFLSRCDYIRE